MNKSRRNRLLSAIHGIMDYADRIQEIIDEEQVALDNLPDSLREAPAAEEASSNLDDIQEAHSDLMDAIEQIKTSGTPDA